MVLLASHPPAFKMNDQQFDSSVTDQEYLIRRARSALEVGDQWQAKSWMLTAKCLFPDSFNIQLEAYTSAKNASQTKEAASCLQSLCDKFPGEGRLQGEVQAVMAALRSLAENGDEDKGDKFFVDMFEQLEEAGRKKMIVSAAESVKDPVEHCRLMLILLDRFPTEVVNFGEKLLETVNSLEKQEAGTNSPMNEYRALLVVEVLPAILQIPENVKVPPKLLTKNIYKAIEFIVALVNRKGKDGGGIEVKEPWKLLIKILSGVGTYLGWSLCPNLPSVEELLPQLAGMTRAAGQSPPESPLSQQVFHLASVICLQTVFQYSVLAREKEVLLVEAFVTHDMSDKTNKRRKTLDDSSSNLPVISHGSSTGLEDPLIHSFQLACSAWQLVSSSSVLETWFQGLLVQLTNSIGQMNVVAQFSAEFRLHTGQFREAGQEVRQLISSSSNPSCLTLVKLAAVQFCLGDQRGAAQSIVDCVNGLSNITDRDTGTVSTGLTLPTSKARHMRFLPATRHCVLAYCCRLLSGLLQERALQHDLALGHTLVILQYNWPEQRELFYLLLHRIKTKETFTYPLFTQFIVNIDILEEMMFLASEQGGGLGLDIVPGGALPGGRMGTRGANRGEREEFRQAMKKQAARSHEPVDKVVIEFLTSHTELLLQCLA